MNNCQYYDERIGCCDCFECKFPCDYAAYTGDCKNDCEHFFNCGSCESSPQKELEEKYPTGTIVKHKKTGCKYVVNGVYFIPNHEYLHSGWYLNVYNLERGPLFNNYPIRVSFIDSIYIVEKLGEKKKK